MSLPCEGLVAAGEGAEDDAQDGGGEDEHVVVFWFACFCLRVWGEEVVSERSFFLFGFVSLVQKSGKRKIF